MKYFVFLIFIFCSIQSLLAQESTPLNEDKLTDLIEKNFIENKVPLRYYSNILIRLDGFVTSQDSLIFQELVDTLNILIDKWDVYLIPRGTSNLIFEMNPLEKPKNNVPFKDIKNGPVEIIQNKIYIKSLNRETDIVTRKKIIRYYLLRSLVVFKFNSYLVEKIPGSVFAASEPEKITFNPVDFQIIKKVYSQEYEDKLNERKPRVLPFKMKKRMLLLFLSQLSSYLLAILFIFIFYKERKFNHKNYQINIYLKNGLYIIVACLIFVLVHFFSWIYFDFLSTYSSVSFTFFVILAKGIFVFVLLGIIITLSLFYIEKAILKNRDNLILEIVVPFLTTLTVPSVFVSILFLSTISLDSLPSIINISNLMFGIVPFIGLLATLRALFIFLNKKSENIIRQKDVELAKLGELHKQAELQSIRSKINPHFLYNSLNSIASLATNDAQKTEKMALALSDFFKYSINREQKQFNTIREELTAVQTYLEIEKVRFGDRLNFKIDCDEELCDIQIPQLLIQPLVENAIKHGLSNVTENGFLKIKVSKHNQLLKIQVFDNGPNFPNGPLTGFGIRNTNKRIALLYGEKAKLNWQNEPDKFIEITLPISKI